MIDSLRHARGSRDAPRRVPRRPDTRERAAHRHLHRSELQRDRRGRQPGERRPVRRPLRSGRCDPGRLGSKPECRGCGAGRGPTSTAIRFPLRRFPRPLRSTGLVWCRSSAERRGSREHGARRRPGRLSTTSACKTACSLFSSPAERTERPRFQGLCQSGRRDSNPRPSAWKAAQRGASFRAMPPKRRLNGESSFPTG